MLAIAINKRNKAKLTKCCERKGSHKKCFLVTRPLRGWRGKGRASVMRNEHFFNLYHKLMQHYPTEEYDNKFSLIVLTTRDGRLGGGGH